jgi:hypothetical protein
MTEFVTGIDPEPLPPVHNSAISSFSSMYCFQPVPVLYVYPVPPVDINQSVSPVYISLRFLIFILMAFLLSVISISIYTRSLLNLIY